MACDRQRGFSWFIIRPCLLALAAVTVLICAASTTAQQPALPNLPAECPPPQATLLPCISYFTGNSSSPPTACCSQIQAMFESQAPCLCTAMASAPSFQLGSAFGAAQALLPSACNLPPNACSGGSTSSGSTSTTPPASGTTAAAPTPATTDADPTTAGGGQKAVPGLVDSVAASDYLGVSAAAVLVSLFVAYVF